MMSSLKTLDLSYNRIGDKGACALGSMLRGEGVASSLPLQSLELEGNQVGRVVRMGGGGAVEGGLYRGGPVRASACCAPLVVPCPPLECSSGA